MYVYVLNVVYVLKLHSRTLNYSVLSLVLSTFLFMLGKYIFEYICIIYRYTFNFMYCVKPFGLKFSLHGVRFNVNQ